MACFLAWTQTNAARMAISVFPKPTSPQITRFIGLIRAKSLITSLMQFCWSEVGMYGKSSENF